MTIFKAVRQLWSGPEEAPEDRNRILKERIAQLLDETSYGQALSRAEQMKEPDCGAVPVTKG
jgi:hypothetical protein